MKCCKVGCDKPALWQPMIKLWAKSTPAAARHEKNCAKAYILGGVGLCDACRLQAESSREFENMMLEPGNIDKVKGAFALQGHAEPDLASAAIVWVAAA